ncbi:MAG: YggS family pyridoxal phosphate-dependent enzyme [Magnetococcales bacterium]|nr:YggS family pyridoxal phosphate-dependent enzyme [Magnetococcales bacterium]
MSSSIADTLAQIEERIHQACQRAGRSSESVRLLAVSKRKPAADVTAALAAGQTLFGENRIQEAREKIPEVNDPRAEWHLIGPLQRNKVKYAVKLFHMVHSLDSLSLASELDKRIPQERTPLSVLLQVNVGREPQKSGFDPSEVEEAARAVSEMANLRVCGLMAIPPYDPDPEAVRPHFRALAELAKKVDNLSISGISMEELSMGMSHDFECAIEEGATLVRVGSALFGPRL